MQFSTIFISEVTKVKTVRYGDVQVTLLRRTLASSPSSECANSCQLGRARGKTLLQQNPPVPDWVRQLYNGRRMVVVGQCKI